MIVDSLVQSCAFQGIGAVEHKNRKQALRGLSHVAFIYCQTTHKHADNSRSRRQNMKNQGMP